MDGLDEADPVDRGIRLGLPSLLPDGVFVIATHRAGSFPGRPDAPHVTLPIAKDDDRNRDDMSRHLSALATHGFLAGELRQARLNPAEFTGLLTARCAGVWVHLRYVLDEPPARDTPAG